MRVGSNRNFATKYCEAYLSWFAWLLKHRDQPKEQKIRELLELSAVGRESPRYRDVNAKEPPAELIRTHI
jgi:hypothetical protein